MHFHSKTEMGLVYVLLPLLPSSALLREQRIFGWQTGCTHCEPKVSDAHGSFVGVSQLPIVDELWRHNITDPNPARNQAPTLLF